MIVVAGLDGNLTEALEVDRSGDSYRHRPACLTVEGSARPWVSMHSRGERSEVTIKAWAHLRGANVMLPAPTTWSRTFDVEESRLR